jgi:hypothetical protein
VRIIYVDESGTPQTSHPDPHYPVFVLAGCVFKPEKYADGLANAVCRLKISYFGSDSIVLHESEIRKRLGPFRFKGDEPKQQAFLSEIADTLRLHVPEIIAVAAKPSSTDIDLSILALETLVSKACQESMESTHWVFEQRGKREDASMGQALARIVPQDMHTWEFVPKSRGLPGLEMAAMVARPIGLSVLRPQQPNRALEEIRDRLNLTIK